MSYTPTTLDFKTYDLEEMRERAASFYEEMDRRRSVRHFSNRDVPKEMIEYAIRTAGTAPSGAHRQPWTFVAVRNADLKREIREAVEEEEKKNYDERMTDEWLDALSPIGTDWQKPFLDTVPWIVVCFAQSYGVDEEGEKVKHYYVQESVGIACGLFIAALHRMGLATLTHTPAPMRFLSDILDRPSNERPYILFPVGFPAEDADVPALERKDLEGISEWKM